MAIIANTNLRNIPNNCHECKFNVLLADASSWHDRKCVFTESNTAIYINDRRLNCPLEVEEQEEDYNVY